MGNFVLFRVLAVGSRDRVPSKLPTLPDFKRPVAKLYPWYLGSSGDSRKDLRGLNSILVKDVLADGDTINVDVRVRGIKTLREFMSQHRDPLDDKVRRFFDGNSKNVQQLRVGDLAPVFEALGFGGTQKFSMDDLIGVAAVSNLNVFDVLRAFFASMLRLLSSVSIDESTDVIRTLFIDENKDSLSLLTECYLQGLFNDLLLEENCEVLGKTESFREVYQRFDVFGHFPSEAGFNDPFSGYVFFDENLFGDVPQMKLSEGYWDAFLVWARNERYHVDAWEPPTYGTSIPEGDFSKAWHLYLRCIWVSINEFASTEALPSQESSGARFESPQLLDMGVARASDVLDLFPSTFPYPAFQVHLDEFRDDFFILVQDWTVGKVAFSELFEAIREHVASFSSFEKGALLYSEEFRVKAYSMFIIRLMEGPQPEGFRAGRLYREFFAIYGQNRDAGFVCDYAGVWEIFNSNKWQTVFQNVVKAFRKFSGESDITPLEYALFLLRDYQLRCLSRDTWSLQPPIYASIPAANPETAEGIESILASLGDLDEDAREAANEMTVWERFCLVLGGVMADYSYSRPRDDLAFRNPMYMDIGEALGDQGRVQRAMDKLEALGEGFLYPGKVATIVGEVRDRDVVFNGYLKGLESLKLWEKLGGYVGLLAAYLVVDWVQVDRSDLGVANDEFGESRWLLKGVTQVLPMIYQMMLHGEEGFDHLEATQFFKALSPLVFYLISQSRRFSVFNGADESLLEALKGLSFSPDTADFNVLNREITVEMVEDLSKETSPVGNLLAVLLGVEQSLGPWFGGVLGVDGALVHRVKISMTVVLNEATARLKVDQNFVLEIPGMMMAPVRLLYWVHTDSGRIELELFKAMRCFGSGGFEEAVSSQASIGLSLLGLNVSPRVLEENLDTSDLSGLDSESLIRLMGYLIDLWADKNELLVFGSQLQGDFLVRYQSAIEKIEVYLASVLDAYIKLFDGQEISWNEDLPPYGDLFRSFENKDWPLIFRLCPKLVDLFDRLVLSEDDISQYDDVSYMNLLRNLVRVWLLLPPDRQDRNILNNLRLTFELISSRENFDGFVLAMGDSSGWVRKFVLGRVDEESCGIDRGFGMKVLLRREFESVLRLASDGLAKDKVAVGKVGVGTLSKSKMATLSASLVYDLDVKRLTRFRQESDKNRDIRQVLGFQEYVTTFLKANTVVGYGRLSQVLFLLRLAMSYESVRAISGPAGVEPPLKRTHTWMRFVGPDFVPRLAGLILMGLDLMRYESRFMTVKRLHEELVPFFSVFGYRPESSLSISPGATSLSVARLSFFRRLGALASLVEMPQDFGQVRREWFPQVIVSELGVAGGGGSARREYLHCLVEADGERKADRKAAYPSVCEAPVKLALSPLLAALMDKLYGRKDVDLSVLDEFDGDSEALNGALETIFSGGDFPELAQFLRLLSLDGIGLIGEIMRGIFGNLGVEIEILDSETLFEIQFPEEFDLSQTGFKVGVVMAYFINGKTGECGPVAKYRISFDVVFKGKTCVFSEVRHRKIVGVDEDSEAVQRSISEIVGIDGVMGSLFDGLILNLVDSSRLSTGEL